jgi:hypothetical protein
VKLSELVRKLADKREVKRLIREERTQQRWRVGFSNMDSRTLADIPDDYLANLQAGTRPETAPYIRAQQEWQRRLIVRQVRAALWASVIGVIGVILGVILGWLLKP